MKAKLLKLLRKQANTLIDCTGKPKLYNKFISE